MKKIDLAYTAGIMDGEGCIRLVRKKSKARIGYSYQLRVSIANTNQWLLHSLRMQYNGRVYDKCSGKNKPLWEWCSDARIALRFLESLLPYLKLKRPEAELAIKFQKHRPSRPTKQDYINQEAQRILMKKLKK